MIVWVHVMLKNGVLDPQGQAIADALHRLGHPEVAEVRAGKLFRLDVSVSDPAKARDVGAKMADRLLANPVIEDFEVEVEAGEVTR